MGADLLNSKRVRIIITGLVLLTVMAWIGFVATATPPERATGQPLLFGLALLVMGLVVFYLAAKNFISSSDEQKTDNPPTDDFAIRVVREIVLARIKQWPRAFLRVVSGEGHPNVYTPRLLNTLRANREFTSGAIEVIVGPIILLNKDNPKALPPIIYMAREGLIKVFIALKRQSQHFVSALSGLTYIEDPHLPKADLRDGIKRKNVMWRVRQLQDQFAKITHQNSTVVPFSESVLQNSVIFMTDDQMENLLARLTHSLDHTASEKEIITRLNSMGVAELKALAGERLTDYFELEDLDPSYKWLPEGEESLAA